MNVNISTLINLLGVSLFISGIFLVALYITTVRKGKQYPISSKLDIVLGIIFSIAGLVISYYI